MSAIEVFADTLGNYLEPDQVNLVRRAYFYAEQAHDGQTRRSGEPYVTHPLAVANILADMHMDHQSLMAAMLHDVIEDTGIPKDALVEQFGDTVAELVDGVSKLTQMTFESKAEAQAENFQKMALAMARDIRVILVKLADRLHNMRTLGALAPEKRRRIAKETLEIYAPIANRLGMHSLSTEFEDLGFKAMYPMRSMLIDRAVRNARGNRKELLNRILESLQACLEREGLQGKVMGREKHLYGIYQKMRGKKKSFNEIMDVYAFRIIVDKPDTCYRVLGAVHSLYKPFPGRFKDYIAIPKANGYQSLHTTLFGMHGVPIEIQIRTDEMEELANNGIAAHWVYKSKDEVINGNHARTRQWLKSVLELQQNAGNSLEFIENVKIDLFPDEVYIFTPKGRIMELPKGSTPVDFAYAVHTDIGNSCIACRVNRRLAPLSEPLESGETVEIITAPGARPNPAWLSFVITGKARSNIRHFLKHQRHSESIALGERLLDKVLASFGTQLSDIPEARIQAVLTDCQMELMEDLLADIGLGNRMAYVVARRLLAAEGASEEEDTQKISPDSNADNSEKPLAIRGTEGLVVSFARCCNPIPGDPIVGYLSSGKGMVIHQENCRNLADNRHNSEKTLHLTWDKDVSGEFTVELRVELEHQRGIIAQLATGITVADASIDKISVDERDGRVSVVQLVVRVRDRLHLSQLIKRIRNLKGVMRITRLKN
ncbi:bifunctional GTP diphosphokinase/guanosine-3',5'-bis pyrophosphate 3'-pyrophosphohydrolase [Halopseudomonas aestusnigri]|jgi:RelA/SpoT family (p)ppGpp synthetase|uniref:bifunctional GTP diphosphokinase/guanosine-3',5'-bis pyrophosphate 3'-pyrophosphohydrolase n=1 Tax=Halopseudomonas aestusnigri TaxID=857252 RepID=UPI000C94800A|nr:bifunctional GTP diphosphokinase/guanosine-3',5'-bis pyrophosphate 3'-pyrophosphohydrolase [Halopseudomonas aestusnigri]MAK73063.1 bifunctional GTP diphosphokinase/guanosine-3',5'-bis(diphosphate) 3'-diphosphatase [Pseudomonadales bacterium]MEE2799484.1 bifunctional GTP diphosphokinase/guanosine-3',5'-bis pyrophosphate 3'-pyrophosphohydrolase [Pseudomonadota bacterium]HBT56998.1 guanosine-3',5'-bis(diphosphate) 3'-diphosphatase [Pseudomonas sp.]MAP76588.1 bifunctional GTP diphosphokinase/gua|tara:strand:- start:2924 stop:5068 length:2145 start_codon:yes stop_codon:yes gene_type:complete